MKVLRAVALLFSLSSCVLGQLITTINPAGETIVEQITTNAFGQPLTQILQTLGGATSVSSTTAAAAATTSPIPTTTTSQTTAAAANTNPQVVGQPGSTPETPGGPTPFVYTTTDANGNYITVSATFTPTFPSTTPFTATGTGTVLKYSDWLSQVGTNTGAFQSGASQAANPASRACPNISVLSGAVLTTVLAGVVGGWVLIL